MNGRKDKDLNIGKYTFVNNRGCSVVDYLLCKSKMCDCIDSFEVDCPNIVSDHCLISVSFIFHKNEKVLSDERYIDEEFESVNYKYVWNDDLKDEYIDLLDLHITHFIRIFLTIKQDSIIKY